MPTDQTWDSPAPDGSRFPMRILPMMSSFAGITVQHEDLGPMRGLLGGLLDENSRTMSRGNKRNEGLSPWTGGRADALMKQINAREIRPARSDSAGNRDIRGDLSMACDHLELFVVRCAPPSAAMIGRHPRREVIILPSSSSVIRGVGRSGIGR